MEPTFRSLALESAPFFVELLTSDPAESAWRSNPATGKSLELATFAFLAGAVEKLGGNPKVAEILLDNPELFLVRNEVPQHHGAQVGHAGAQRPFSDLYMASFMPKMTFDFGGRHFALFREGYPIHAIEHFVRTHELYKDRPDFLIIEGSFMVSSDGGISSIFAEYQHGTALAKLREVNGRHPQLIDWEIDLPQLPPPAAIIECSWNKSEAVAARQLERYMELMPPVKPEQTLFVSSATSVANEIQTLKVPRGARNSELIVSPLANFLKNSLALRCD